MAVVWMKQAKRGNGVAIKKSDKTIDVDFDDTYLVRCDSQDTNRLDIANAPGIGIGDPHPEYAGVTCQEITAKPTGDTGLMWAVSIKYAIINPAADDNSNNDELELPRDVWTAGGSSRSVPCFKDRFGNIITNTAGDPLEGLEKEECEYTLNLSRPYATHGAWMSVAASHVDCVNDNVWHGGAVETWLCRFRSAQLEVKITESGGLIYWSTQWEFAFKATTWRLMPWNIGYHELPEGGWSPGAGAPGGDRKAILGADGKPVKSPVALNADGTAKPAGQPPDVVVGADAQVGVPVHDLADFSVFGEIFTPTF